jgi:hypothetical protein
MNAAWETGATVRWYTKDGGWHFGRVVETGYKWARVACAGMNKRVLIDDLRAWPPAARPTGDSQKVKRGRA